MMLKGIIALALIGVVFGSPYANQYIDNVLQTSYPQNLRNMRVEPAALPNFNVSFGPRSVYTSQSVAEFFNGNATGFFRLQRRQDCQGPKYFAQQYSINCTLRLYSLTTSYAVSVRNGSTVYYVRNMGHVDETIIDVEIVGNAVGVLRSFRITRFGQVNPTFTGLPQKLNAYVKVLQDAYKANVSSYLYNILQNGVQYAFARSLENKSMPRQ